MPHIYLKDIASRNDLFNKLSGLKGFKRTLFNRIYRLPGSRACCIEVSKQSDVILRVEASFPVRIYSPFAIFNIWKNHTKLQAECDPIVKDIVSLAEANKIPFELIYIDWRPRFIKISLITLACITISAVILTVFMAWKLV